MEFDKNHYFEEKYEILKFPHQGFKGSDKGSGSPTCVEFLCSEGSETASGEKLSNIPFKLKVLKKVLGEDRYIAKVLKNLLMI